MTEKPPGKQKTGGSWCFGGEREEVLRAAAKAKLFDAASRHGHGIQRVVIGQCGHERKTVVCVVF